MNDDLDEKYVTYNSMKISAAIVITIWVLTTCAIDRINEKIYDIEKRLTRTEAICYGTGQSQPD